MSTLGPASPKQEMMLKSDAQITVIGGAAGSGKSYMLTMMPLRYVDDPKFDAIIFRRQTTQVRGQGGMYDTAQDIYLDLPEEHKPKFRDSDLRASFPTGATVKWSHMEHEKDRFAHQGLQYSFIGFDEGTHFTWSQVEYLMSRMRSGAAMQSRMVISCNPDPDCEWLLELVKWYLDEDGYPVPEKDGVVRFFIRRNDMFIWGDTKQELYDKYGKRDDHGKLLPEDHHLQIRPLSFTFISATIYDNPPLLETNPDYLAFLEGLNEVDKARLLHGNWYARPQGANYFKREWCPSITKDKLPSTIKFARAWDKASQEPSDVYKYPDYTASIKMGRCKDGFFYILGDFCDEAKDPDENIYGRFRKRPGERDRIIEAQAQYDEEEVTIYLPVDPGAAGKVEYQESAKKLIMQGFQVKPDPTPNNKSKLTKFTPFASAAENGLVYIVEDSFPNKETLEAFLRELEAFDGERSTATRKDDWPDSTATAFNGLCKVTVLPSFNLDYKIPSTKIESIKN